MSTDTWTDRIPVPDVGAVVDALDAAYAELLPRLPLSISAAAEALGVSVHALRWYESLGLIDVPRTASGYRSYDASAMSRAVFLTRMRASGMPVDDLRRYVRLVEEGPASIGERRGMLEAHRTRLVQQLTEIAAALAITDYKLARYGTPSTERLDALAAERAWDDDAAFDLDRDRVRGPEHIQTPDRDPTAQPKERP